MDLKWDREDSLICNCLKYNRNLTGPAVQETQSCKLAGLLLGMSSASGLLLTPRDAGRVPVSQSWRVQCEGALDPEHEAPASERRHGIHWGVIHPGVETGEQENSYELKLLNKRADIRRN